MVVAIEAVGLTKYYGDTPGIIDLDLEVTTGEVFGFLGPNGAGKSTTIRTFLDLLHPTGGTVAILGLDSHEQSVDIRARTGYLPGDLSMYDDMTAREMLRYFSSLRKTDTEARVQELAERLQLDLDRKIGSYSSGNRQKVGVIQAFMHEPELLILDEPSTGLDPLMQQEFYRMIDETRKAGRTVFLSSHILPEVERTADRVGIVRNGRLVTVQTVNDLKAKARRRFQIVFAEKVRPGEFSELPGVQSALASHDGYGVEILIEGPVDRVLAKAAEHRMENVISHEGDLEEAFLTFYEEEPAADPASLQT
ncbi:MAG: ABC transporter ATP-binding protein [Acidimicrobiia bacterium]|nr:MAG: ABC transporter ATP-binding protein [Acidimicrobiia bacterium]